jgi:exodeoxyribonuclease VII small subunit
LAQGSIDSPQALRYRARMPKPSAQPSPQPAEANAVAQFEQSLDELEKLVARMEGGELNLDESLRSFERGIALYRNCQAALEQAEARVKLLLDPEHPESARPFAPPEER